MVQFKDLGIEIIYPDSKVLLDCIEIINPMYKGKELEYFYAGYKHLPRADSVSDASNSLSTTLDQYYKDEYKRDSKKIS